MMPIGQSKAMWQCKWRHLVAKLVTNASTWWPKLEPMEYLTWIFFLTEFAFFFAGKIAQIIESIPCFCFRVTAVFVRGHVRPTKKSSLTPLGGHRLALSARRLDNDDNVGWNDGDDGILMDDEHDQKHTILLLPTNSDMDNPLARSTSCYHLLFFLPRRRLHKDVFGGSPCSVQACSNNTVPARPSY